MNNLKIGIVCYPTQGGSGIVATELAQSLANLGHEIHIISYCRPFRLKYKKNKNIFFHEVTTYNYPLFEYTPYEINLTSKIVDVSVNYNLDLVHVHYAIPHASAALSAKQILRSLSKELPIVTTLHGTDITLIGKDKSFKPVIEFAINNSDIVTSVSKSLKEDTLKNFKIKKEIKIIPNFIDSALYFPTGENDKAEKIITHVSNFRKVKKVDHVLRVFYKVQKKINCSLNLIGDGPELKKIKELSKKLNIEKRVHFKKYSRKIHKELKNSTLFLLTSEKESFGLSALEAISSGVPVISTNVGGLTEIVVDGVTGFVSKLGDIKKMSDDCIKLLLDNDLYLRIRKNCVKHSKKYSISKVVPQYIKIYNELLK